MPLKILEWLSGSNKSDVWIVLTLAYIYIVLAAHEGLEFTVLLLFFKTNFQRKTYNL